VCGYKKASNVVDFTVIKRVRSKKERRNLMKEDRAVHAKSKFSTT
jgi:hypothetical protein